MSAILLIGGLLLLQGGTAEGGQVNLIEFLYEGAEVKVWLDRSGEQSRVSLPGFILGRISDGRKASWDQALIPEGAEYVTAEVAGTIESMWIRRTGERALPSDRLFAPQAGVTGILKRTRTQDACVAAAFAQYQADMNQCQLIYDFATTSLGFTVAGLLAGCTGPQAPVCGPLTGGGGVIAYAIIRWQYERCKQAAADNLVANAASCQ